MRKFYALLFVFVITLASEAQWNGFQSVQTYPVADTANLIHVKDITGDGIPDLTVLYTAYDRNWEILKGSGDGTFRPLPAQVKEDNYLLSDIADLNSDGRPDMVISSYWNNGFTIWWGMGGGRLTKGPYLYTGVHGRAVKCVDINKDGVMDIVSTTSGSGQTIHLHVFLGKGDGTFEPKQTFASVLDTCRELYITDQNNDGRWDVASSSSFPWMVIFVQQADGTFAPTYHPTFHAARPAIADVNNDGREDLVLLYASFDNIPDSDSLIIKLNNGSNYLSPSIRVQAFENSRIRPYQVRTADINRDGFIDLLFNHTDMDGEPTDTLYYMLGKGHAQFETPVAMKMPDRVVYIALADVNGDQWVDLIVSCRNKTVNVSLSHHPVVGEGEAKLVQVYPNPAKTVFYVTASIKTPHRVRLYNGAGQLVKEQRAVDTTTTVYTQGLPAGIYYLEIKGEEANSRQAIWLQ